MTLDIRYQLDERCLDLVCEGYERRSTLSNDLPKAAAGGYHFVVIRNVDARKRKKGFRSCLAVSPLSDIWIECDTAIALKWSVEVHPPQIGGHIWCDHHVHGISLLPQARDKGVEESDPERLGEDGTTQVHDVTVPATRCDPDLA